MLWHVVYMTVNFNSHYWYTHRDGKPKKKKKKRYSWLRRTRSSPTSLTRESLTKYHFPAGASAVPPPSSSAILRGIWRSDGRNDHRGSLSRIGARTCHTQNSIIAHCQRQLCYKHYLRHQAYLHVSNVVTPMKRATVFNRTIERIQHLILSRLHHQRCL
jgi:hypothetical protein